MSCWSGMSHLASAILSILDLSKVDSCGVSCYVLCHGYSEAFDQHYLILLMLQQFKDNTDLWMGLGGN